MEIEGLKGRVAVVTAAGQNIGKAVALAFAKAGAHLVINGKSSQKKLDTVAAEAKKFGAEVMTTVADATDADAIAKMVDDAAKRFGRIDVAVSMVGIRPFQAFHDISLADWNNVLANNVTSAFILDRAVLPHMRRRKWGRIIHMAGTDALFPLANRAHVVASKHALHGLAKAIALEYGPDGITANSIAPGWLHTDRNPAWFPDLANTVRHLEATLPLRHLGTADDVANACIYLASDLGKFVTGHVIHINGGEFMV